MSSPTLSIVTFLVCPEIVLDVVIRCDAIEAWHDPCSTEVSDFMNKTDLEWKIGVFTKKFVFLWDLLILRGIYKFPLSSTKNSRANFSSMTAGNSQREINQTEGTISPFSFSPVKTAPECSTKHFNVTSSWLNCWSSHCHLAKYCRTRINPGIRICRTNE